MIQEVKIIELNSATIGYKAKTHSVNVVKAGISVYALKVNLLR